MVSAQILNGIPLFSGLDQAALAELVKVIELRPVERGAVLFEKGDKRKEFFVVVSGAVHVYRLFNDEVQTLALLDPTDFAVESALVDSNLEHQHNAEVTKAGQVLVIDGRSFQKFSQTHPQIANALYGRIIANLTERLHHANNKLVTLYATGKIASSYSDLYNLIDLLLKTIVSTIRSQKAVFAWYRPLENRIVIQEAIGYSDDQSIVNLKLSIADDPILGEIYRTHRDIFVRREDYAEKPHLRTPYSSETMLGVKIRIGERVVGAILLGDKAGGRNFSYNNQILLHIIVKQVALSIQEAEVAEDKSQREEQQRVYIPPL